MNLTAPATAEHLEFDILIHGMWDMNYESHFFHEIRIIYSFAYYEDCIDDTELQLDETKSVPDGLPLLLRSKLSSFDSQNAFRLERYSSCQKLLWERRCRLEGRTFSTPRSMAVEQMTSGREKETS